MGKLVRDKIPQIITDAGKKPITEILEQERYLEELDKKLEEEVAEYQADKSIEEMADVLVEIVMLGFFTSKAQVCSMMFCESVPVLICLAA